MLFLLLLTPLSLAAENSFIEPKQLNSPIFNWFVVLNFWKQLFNGKTIYRFTFNSTEPNLTFITSSVIGSKIEEGQIQRSINNTMNQMSSRSEKNTTSANTTATTPAAGSIHLLEHTLYNRPVFPVLPIKLSQSTLLEKDFAEELSGSFSSLGISHDDGIIVVRNIYTMALVIVPITVIFVLGLIYYIFYCFCCCCPCCRRKEHKKPSIVLIIFFIIGLIIIAMGYVFTCVSFIPFDDIKEMLSTIPAQIDDTSTSLSNSSIALTDLLSAKFAAIVANAKSAVKQLLAIPEQTTSEIRAILYGLLDKLTSAVEDSAETWPIKAKGLIPFYAQSINKTAHEISGSNTDYQSYYDPDFFALVGDGYREIDNQLKEIADQMSALDEISDFSSELQDLDSSLDSLEQFCDTFDVANQLVDSFEDIMDISTMKIEGKPLKQYLSELKDTPSIKSIKDQVSDINKGIDDYFLYVKIGYIFLWSLNLFLIIGFAGSFFCYNCCAGCVAACAECYPCVCSFFMFIFGFICTALCTLIVYFGKNLPEAIDGGINAAIDKGIPNRILTFPEIDLSDKLNKNVSKCQLPPMNLTNLTIYQTAINSKLGTGLDTFLSLDKIFDFKAITDSLSTFIDDVHTDFGIEKTIKDKVQNISDDLTNSDVLPNTFDDNETAEPPTQGFYNKYINQEGQEDVWSQIESNCREIERIYKETAESICNNTGPHPACCDASPGAEYSSATCQKADSKYVVPTIKTFEAVCLGHLYKYLGDNNITLHDKLKEKYNETAIQQDKNSLSSAISGLVVKVSNVIANFISMFKSFIKAVTEDFVGILKEVKADPIINAYGLIHNILVYCMAFWTTTISMGCTLVLIGFIVSVILMCIRRRGMLKEGLQADTQYSASGYSDDSSNSLNFSKRKTVREVSSESYTPSYSSSNNERNRRNGNLRV